MEVNKRYSAAFKQKVVTEIEKGVSRQKSSDK